MDSYNLTHTGAELDSAVGRALEGFEMCIRDRSITTGNTTF